jgi:hypothetical protein
MWLRFEAMGVLACAWGICAAMASPVRGALRAYDGFDYAVGSVLEEQDGGSGFALRWNEPPVIVEAVDRNPPAETIAEGNLSFGPLVTFGNRVITGGEFSFDGRGLSLSPAPTTVYASMLLRRERNGDGGQYNVGDYGGLEIDGSVNSVLLGDSAENELYSIEIAGVGFPVESSSRVITGETAFLVAKVTFTADNENVDLYVNPAPGRPEPATASVSRNDLNLGSLTGIGISTGTNATWSVDEIRVGDSFADVTPSLFIPVSGDANLDGVVNHLDFDVLYENFGTGTTWVQGDFDGDGRVSFVDFQAMERNFGGTVIDEMAEFSASHVPEPAGALFVAGMACLGALRRWRCRAQ